MIIEQLPSVGRLVRMLCQMGGDRRNGVVVPERCVPRRNEDHGRLVDETRAQSGPSGFRRQEKKTRTKRRSLTIRAPNVRDKLPKGGVHDQVLVLQSVLPACLANFSPNFTIFLLIFQVITATIMNNTVF